MKGYLKVLEQKLEKMEKHFLNRFKDPNIYYILNESIICAARKDHKVYNDILSNLIINIVETDENDIFIDVSEQAIKIIPNLKSQHIALLSMLYYLFNLQLGNLKELETTSKSILKNIRNIKNKENISLNYLFSLRLLLVNYSQKINIYEFWKVNDKYSSKNKNIIQFQDEINNTSPSTKKIIDIFHELIKVHIILTPVGMLIAGINLNRLFPKFDYKIWNE